MADPTGHPGLVPLLDGYQFDVFISYRRSGPGNASTWVRNYFHRMLEDCLADELGRTAVFIDSAVETGAVWPPLLREALARSKVLVAVWSPPYFHSPWRLAEWRTMEARERELGGTARLVYPVRCSDGDNFPDDAKQRQQFDVRGVSNPFPAFGGSHRQADLFDTVRVISGEVAKTIAAVPPWRADWPECQIPIWWPRRSRFSRCSSRDRHLHRPAARRHRADDRGTPRPLGLPRPVRRLEPR